MSLISRKAIQIAGPDRRDEKITTWRKETDKTYTKITKIVSRDWKTGLTKEMKRDKPVEEGPFVQTLDTEEADEKMKYEDIDGAIKYIYFKRINNQ